MVYPSRPALRVLPQFVGTAGTQGQSPEQRQRLREFVAAEYAAGRSLRELGELTGRSQSAVRRSLDEAGVRRRPRGAQPASADRRGRPNSER
ncbi:helix-turn-helix domain-containing protein [Pseudactinotalea sp.]|uniref:helix-turn-helix domain-containing protein n=1 Tax=Pseudactinotalea sp. TaxID=1926260 RepID=UPI003B3ACE8E